MAEEETVEVVEEIATGPQYPELAPYVEKPVPGRFDGMTAIVTGAGSGIGRATAVRIGKEGGRVIAADYAQEGLDSLVAEYPDLDIVPVRADITKHDDVERIVDACDGECQALANVAGIMDKFCPIGEVSDELWDRVFEVNVGGTMKMTKAVLPLMLEEGGGTIVNVASLAGITGAAAGAAYTASKWAVVGMTKNTAHMYAPYHIRVNAIAPGGVRTNIGVEFGSELALHRLAPRMRVAGARTAEPEELAAAIAFLLSPDSPNITGAVLTSDGGYSAA